MSFLNPDPRNRAKRVKCLITFFSRLVQCRVTTKTSIPGGPLGLKLGTPTQKTKARMLPGQKQRTQPCAVWQICCKSNEMRTGSEQQHKNYLPEGAAPAWFSSQPQHLLIKPHWHWRATRPLCVRSTSLRDRTNQILEDSNPSSFATTDTCSSDA